MRYFEKPFIARHKEQENLSPQGSEAFIAVGDGQASLDQVAEAIGADVPEAAGILFELEVKGFLACENGLYSKSKF